MCEDRLCIHDPILSGWSGNYSTAGTKGYSTYFVTVRVGFKQLFLFIAHSLRSRGKLNAAQEEAL
jgi:hypothetical protein